MTKVHICAQVSLNPVVQFCKICLSNIIQYIIPNPIILWVQFWVFICILYTTVLCREQWSAGWFRLPWAACWPRQLTENQLRSTCCASPASRTAVRIHIIVPSWLASSCLVFFLVRYFFALHGISFFAWKCFIAWHFFSCLVLFAWYRYVYFFPCLVFFYLGFIFSFPGMFSCLTFFPLFFILVWQFLSVLFAWFRYVYFFLVWCFFFLGFIFSFPGM